MYITLFSRQSNRKTRSSRFAPFEIPFDCVFFFHSKATEFVVNFSTETLSFNSRWSNYLFSLNRLFSLGTSYGELHVQHSEAATRRTSVYRRDLRRDSRLSRRQTWHRPSRPFAKFNATDCTVSNEFWKFVTMNLKQRFEFGSILAIRLN